MVSERLSALGSAKFFLMCMFPVLRAFEQSVWVAFSRESQRVHLRRLRESVLLYITYSALVLLSSSVVKTQADGFLAAEK